MKKKELSGLVDAELNGKVAELQRELVKEYAQVAIGSVPKSPGKIRSMKRTIARIKTILRGRKAKE